MGVLKRESPHPGGVVGEDVGREGLDLGKPVDLDDRAIKEMECKWVRRGVVISLVAPG